MRDMLRVMFVAAPLCCGAPAHPVDVCAVSRDPARYENRIVSVRGIVTVVFGKPYPNGYYFEELYGTECIGKGARRFTARIRLLSPEEDFLAHPPPGYHLDEDSLRTIEKQFNKHRKADGRIRAMVTVEGLLRPLGASPSGATANIYQTELVVQAMRDPFFLDGDPVRR